MGKLASYIQAIQRHYPEIEIEAAVFNQDGQYNDVVILNNRLVFRFAKVQAAIQTLQKEIAVQRSLQGRLSLRIPEPVYANVETETVGEAFVGYAKIPGKPLWRETFEKITGADTLVKIASQLAGFLFELHHIPVEEVIPIPLQQQDTLQEWAEMYQRFQAKLFPSMRPDARRRVAAHFESFFEDPKRYGFEPRLRHGDFGTGNILYDPESASIVGIIDFGGVGLGDPASDFAGLFISYGEAFYHLCCATYPEMVRALDRVRFYCGTFALQEALFGLENEDKDAYQSGMASYL